MNLNEAFRLAVKDYLKNRDDRLKGLKGVQKRMKYDKKYFDRIEEEYFGSVTTLKKGEKKDGK